MTEGGPLSALPDAAPDGFSAEILLQLFADFLEHPHIALAVSGGADSTALMVLVRRWLELAPEPSPHITVLTVDHKLRAASAAEANRVRQRAISLGFRHRTLEWTEAKPKSGIQAAARKARYALMADHCRRHAIPALATAHTEDDQAETVIMRLARGGGVDGLSGMAPRAQLGGIALLRPLLGVSRERIRRFLSESGISWSDDPTNEDAHYERVRVRKALAKLSPLGLSPDKLALTAARLRRARDALDAMAVAKLQAALTLADAGWASMPLDVLANVDDDIAIRMLGRLTLALGGGETPVPLAKIEAACGKLRRAPKSLTLGGCQFLMRGTEMRIVREYGRMPREEAPFKPGMLWDRRFIIEAAPDEAAGLMVRPLGMDGIGLVKEAKGSFGAMPRGAALALPSLWRGHRLAYAPFAQFPHGAPPGWLPSITVRFANASILFDARPEIRL